MRSRLVWIAALASVTLGISAVPQTPAPNAPPAQPPHMLEANGMPPRAAPTEYASHVQMGEFTLAAEFAGHSIPRPEDPLSTTDYVVVEAALFGPPGAHVQLATDNFSLRINDKKNPSPSQPYEVVLSSVKDPEWSPPGEKDHKSKSSINTGTDTGSTPAIVHVPIELQRAMAQYVRTASFPQGDRPLPQAGLLFFEYRGKAQSVHSLELTYSGAAGKATLTLQP